MRSSFAARNANGSSFCQPLANSGSPSNLAYLLRHTNSPSQGKLLHNHLLQCGHSHITFLRNCLIEMYGNCGTVADARSVFDNTPNPNLYSWNLMIRAYALSGFVDDAQNLFNQTPNPDVYTWNILIKAYIKHGALQDARQAFERMPYHSIVSWTAMIAALAYDGRGQEALNLFYRMHAESLTGDKVTFLRALDACSNCLFLIQGQEIHAAIVENGFDEDFVAGTSLISMYGKCESLAHAKAVFFRIRKRDVVCWTAIITAHAQNDHHKEALRLFLQMQIQGLDPDNYTFVCVLDACSGLTLLREGKHVHAAVVQGGLEQQFMMGTALVNLYGKCKSLEDARSVFGGMPYRDVVSWNAMISALVETECNEDALHLFWQMNLQAIKPDNITFICVLHACSNLTTFAECQEIHMAVVEYGHDGDVMVMNSLINVYGKSGSLRDAKVVFNSTSPRDTITWNIMISVYICNDLAKESLNIFKDMQHAFVKADNITFAYAVDACSTVGDLKKGQAIHAILVESGHSEDPTINSALLKMYGKCKSVDDAVHIFENMQEVDIVSWTALIGAYVENGCSEVALDLFYQMQVKGLQLDTTSYVCSLDACASLAALVKGQEIHNAVRDGGIEKDPMVVNALIHMYGNCGNLQNALTIFENLPQPNVATWNAIIAAFAHNGNGDEALDHFIKMQDNSVHPDGITFVSILTACSHAGWITDGRQYFVSMKIDHNVMHTDDHYVCMVDILGRAGQLEEAEHLLKTLSAEKTDMAWLCLLGACKIHNDYERALHAAESFSELDSKNSAPFVMLANMCAAVQEWDTVAQYRRCLLQ